jgi:hypothetical protein
VPFCENRLPGTVALHPVYAGESVVGSRNCLAAVRDSSRIVGKPEVILGPRFVRWSGCQRLYIPPDYRKLTHHLSDKT